MLIKLLSIDPLLYFRIILIVIISITLHELAHGWVAILQGDDTPKTSGHITLDPIVHMGAASLIFLCLFGIAWGQMPVNPSSFRNRKIGNILVSVAGPLCNLALGILFLLILKLDLTFPTISILSHNFLYICADYNFILFIFNMLPIPPLDGFHVFSEFFPRLKDLENSPLAYFALAILFFGGLFTGLELLSDAVICTAIPTLTVCRPEL